MATRAAEEEKAELEVFAREVRKNAKLEAELASLRNGGSKKKKDGDKKKPSTTVIDGQRLNKTEVRELAEKGLSLLKKQENAADKNTLAKKEMNTLKELVVNVGWTSAVLSWAKERTGLWQKLPEVSKHPAAKDGVVAVVLYVLAEQATDMKQKKILISAAISAVAMAGATFGKTFEGADGFAKKVNEKIGAVGPQQLKAVP